MDYPSRLAQMNTFLSPPAFVCKGRGCLQRAKSQPLSPPQHRWENTARTRNPSDRLAPQRVLSKFPHHHRDHRGAAPMWRRGGGARADRGTPGSGQALQAETPNESNTPGNYFANWAEPRLPEPMAPG